MDTDIEEVDEGTQDERVDDLTILLQEGLVAFERYATQLGWVPGRTGKQMQARAELASVAAETIVFAIDALADALAGEAEEEVVSDE